MATVTTTLTLAPTPIPWISPGVRAGNQGRPPIGKIVFTGAGTIPLKDAANESQVIFNFTLPRNFFYRLIFFEWSAQSTALTVFARGTGFEPEAKCEISENGAIQYRFPVQNRLMQDYNTDVLTTIGGAKTDDDAETNDFQAWYRAPVDISQYFIDASQAAVCAATWMDTSADATAATPVQVRAEALKYTIEQAQAWPVSTPQLIFG